MNSRYNDLHDKYHQILSTKAGTRYEMLAALVFKALESQNAVIHDLSLAGEDPAVKHQIDVTVDAVGGGKRTLIECKDFDVSGHKVGLDIVRNFRSVIEDTGADEGIIITCNGFTRDAARYAKSKNIKLAILRIFELQDHDGRVSKVILGITVQTKRNPSVQVSVTEQYFDRYQQELASIGVRGGLGVDDPVYFVRNAERKAFLEFITERMQSSDSDWVPGTVEMRILPDGWQIQVADSTPIPFDALVLSYEVHHESLTTEIVASRIAELILQGFQERDIVIFGDQLERHMIDSSTGDVV